MPCKVKLCFVGHARAGKTSTLLALADKPFHPMQPFLGVEREREKGWHGLQVHLKSNYAT